MKLGIWISNTKTRRATLTPDKVATLAELGLNCIAGRPLGAVCQATEQTPQSVRLLPDGLRAVHVVRGAPSLCCALDRLTPVTGGRRSPRRVPVRGAVTAGNPGVRTAGGRRSS